MYKLYEIFSELRFQMLLSLKVALCNVLYFL